MALILTILFLALTTPALSAILWVNPVVGTSELWERLTQQFRDAGLMDNVRGLNGVDQNRTLRLIDFATCTLNPYKFLLFQMEGQGVHNYVNVATYVDQNGLTLGLHYLNPEEQPARNWCNQYDVVETPELHVALAPAPDPPNLSQRAAHFLRSVIEKIDVCKRFMLGAGFAENLSKIIETVMGFN